MALVMLPCEFPSWITVQRKLNTIQTTNDFEKVLEIMQNIHDLCNIGLDPDDESRDLTILNGLRDFYENDLNNDEKQIFLHRTIKNLAKRAQILKTLKPPRGLNYSLQQQADCVELNRNFVASLLANAFFSTFPKRTEKTHPTLQDFNFTSFFSSLNNNWQKGKFRCFIQYFNWLESQENFADQIKFSRKVMTGKQWLTIEDWTECEKPLCCLDIKHQGRIENAFDDFIQTIFCSPRIGGTVLKNGNAQEPMQMCIAPESLIMLLFTEALEDNEAFHLENVYQIGRMNDPKNKASLEILSEPRKIRLCCIDAENYSAFPIHQFEEDNVLRELNKCLIGFRQNTLVPSSTLPFKDDRQRNTLADSNGRLSPIGESGSNSPKEKKTHSDTATKIIIKQASSTGSTKSRTTNSLDKNNETVQRCSFLTPEQVVSKAKYHGPVVAGPTASGRRGRFITLGSSGENLPVNRNSLLRKGNSSIYSSCESDSEEFHSAKGSFDLEKDENQKFNAENLEMDTPEKRQTFAQRLKDALRQSTNYTDSTESSSYAVGISISDSQDCDNALRLRRGGSTGFVLTEDSLDEEFFIESLEHEKDWLEKFRNRHAALHEKDTGDSSKYSFSSDLSSELDEAYEQLAKWIDNQDKQRKDEDPRNKEVVQFANLLLKRTLSESFVGVPLNDYYVNSPDQAAKKKLSSEDSKETNGKPMLNVRSLSLELAKYKHRIAAQLITQLAGRRHSSGKNSLLAIASGNWGCGHSKKADVQLKLVIQWMAASFAGLPVLAYYTNGHEKLTKLDTVTRVLLDRKWTVGELAIATLQHAREVLDGEEETHSFFEKLIGI